MLFLFGLVSNMASLLNVVMIACCHFPGFSLLKMLTPVCLELQTHYIMFLIHTDYMLI